MRAPQLSRKEYKQLQRAFISPVEVVQYEQRWFVVGYVDKESGSCFEESESYGFRVLCARVERFDARYMIVDLREYRVSERCPRTEDLFQLL